MRCDSKVSTGPWVTEPSPNFMPALPPKLRLVPSGEPVWVRLHRAEPHVAIDVVTRLV
jgi:hypothetical protein